MNGAPFGIDFHHSRTSSRPFCAFKKYDSKFSEKTEYGNSTTLVKHAFMRLVIPAGPKRCKGYWIPRPPDFNGNDESKMKESDICSPTTTKSASKIKSRIFSTTCSHTSKEHDRMKWIIWAAPRLDCKTRYSEVFARPYVFIYPIPTLFLFMLYIRPNRMSPGCTKHRGGMPKRIWPTAVGLVWTFSNRHVLNISRITRPTVSKSKFLFLSNRFLFLVCLLYLVECSIWC